MTTTPKAPSGGAWLSDYPEAYAEWHPTRNEGLDPAAMRAGSNKRVWWRCAEGHEFVAIIFQRTSPRGDRSAPLAGRQRERVHDPYAPAETRRRTGETDRVSRLRGSHWPNSAPTWPPCGSDASNARN
jgi:hypothetical protein